MRKKLIFRQLIYVVAFIALSLRSDAADHFANAQNTPMNSLITESNVLATSEPAEPADIGYKTIWRKFTTTQRCIVTIKTPESPPIGIAHKLSVFRGDSYDTLNLVEANQGLSYGGVAISFPAEAGATFRICLGSFWSDESAANMTFAVTQSTWPFGTSHVIPPPEPTNQLVPNDNVDAALVVPAGHHRATIFGYLGSATTQPYEGFYATGTHATWHSWKASFSGTIKITTGRTASILNFGHRVSIYTFDLSLNMNRIATQWSGQDGEINLNVPVQSGETYLISFGFEDQVASFGQRAYSYVFELMATGSGNPLVVQNPADINQPSGISSAHFAVTAPSEDYVIPLTIRNVGSLPLTGITVSFSGAHSGDFNGLPLSSPSISAGGSLTYPVRFAPSASGIRTAILRIGSNVAGVSPIEIQLSGRTLSFTTDSDNDGLSDAAEWKLAALGFDWATANPDLVTNLKNHANGAGLFTVDQVKALYIPTPVLTRNSATGKFILTMDLKRGLDLDMFEDLPVTASQISVNAAGDIEYEFEFDKNAAFFRLESKP